jgi:ABC-type ATPase involved in cell division
MATHDYNLLKKAPARILKCVDGKILDSNKENFEMSEYTS